VGGIRGKASLGFGLIDLRFLCRRRRRRRLGRGPDDPTSNRGQPDRDRRTWFRLLFESQLAAYEPNAQGQAAQGWYYWTCKSSPTVLVHLYLFTRGLGELTTHESVSLSSPKGKRNGRSIRGLTAVAWKTVTSLRTSVTLPPGHSRSFPMDAWIRVMIIPHPNQLGEEDLGMLGRGREEEW
jgi:hypothetical protein